MSWNLGWIGLFSLELIALECEIYFSSLISGERSLPSWAACLLVFDDVLLLFRIAWWSSAGKQLASCLSTCAVCLCVVLIFMFISRTASEEGSGIPLYQFLIIVVSSISDS